MNPKSESEDGRVSGAIIWPLAMWFAITVVILFTML